MNVLIIQPPIAQLNTAYPSGAYLSAFFKSLGHNTKWLDLNISLFYEIFSQQGLEKIFSLCSENALKLANEAEKSGDEATAFNLRRYVSQKNTWIQWIDTITAILRQGNNKKNLSGYETAHRFVFGAHVPRGSRMETYLANLDHNLTTDDARSLASFALADLADFISVAFDKNFSLVRYAESLTISESSFEQVEKGADSPILKEFYEPLLNRLFLEGEAVQAQPSPRLAQNSPREFCPASGSLPIYKLRQFSKLPDDSVSVIEPLSDEHCDEYKRAVAYEKEVTSSLIPDFSDIDFSQYPRLIDDTNPMHRLWSDGAWLKAYMAHGCYWHKCAFCDVTLDYVKGYCPTNVKKLYEGLLAQCTQKGVFGIHFVDEAMPPALMIAFARENIAHGSPITWWGNVRFEKSFTRDVADFLAYGGLIGVSAGLESATGNGLNAIHKGTDLESIVGACCAFKEAGILVHAYMIYGYWRESPQDLINSMETLRQFYANGLLDSCFWHKFVLTRHSRVYKEWKEGKIPDLKPIDPQEKKNAPLFAKNGLHFEGEKRSEKYGSALDFSLNQWMHGEDLEKPVYKWFDFPVPHPTVPKDFIEKLIAKYEQKRDTEFAKFGEKSHWLGGEKIPLPNGKIGWFYMGEFYTAKKDAPDSEFRGKGLCVLP